MTMTATHIPTDETQSEVVRRLVRFDGQPGEYLKTLLAAQCRIGGAERGALLRLGAGGEVGVIATWPDDSLEPPGMWLAQARELAPKVAASEVPETVALHEADELYGVAPRRLLVVLPIWSRVGVRGAAAFVMENVGPREVITRREQLETSIALLSMYEMRLTAERREHDMRRLQQACQVLGSVNAQTRFQSAAYALCNRIATLWDAERVSLGLVRGRYVHCRAISHTEKFSRKMDEVRQLESAMEESVDQDIEVTHPPAAGSTVISRAAEALAQRCGALAVLTLPLRREGEVVGAVTIERSAHRPIELAEAEALRLTCDLCAARLVELEQGDQWIGAKAARAARRWPAAIVGPRHTWAKLAVMAIAGFVLFATLGRGTYRVDAPFVVQAEQRQIITAPFDGFLLRATARPGDQVTAGETALAELDASQWRIEAAEAEAERQSHLKRAEVMRQEGRFTEAQAEDAEAARLEARVQRLRWRIEQAKLIAPIGGVVTRGDLSRRPGAAVRAGDTLYEIAPLDGLSADVMVEEGRIADVAVGQVGRLVAVSHPDHAVAFEVERIDPVAEVVDQRNVFRVRVRLAERPTWLRPGMEGVAKIDVDERSWAAIWSHDLVNWVRMTLWI